MLFYEGLEEECCFMRDWTRNDVLWGMEGGMVFYGGWEGGCCFMKDGRGNVVL